MLEPIAYTFSLRLPVYEDGRGQFVIDQSTSWTFSRRTVPPKPAGDFSLV
jgi:hypothetical protein